MIVNSHNNSIYENKLNTSTNLKYTSIKNRSYNSIAFEGILTRVAEKSSGVSSELLQALNGISVRDQGIAGIFPKEFLIAIKSNLGSAGSGEIKDCVIGARATLAEAAEQFEKIDASINKKMEKYCENLDLNLYYQWLIKKIELRFCTDETRIIKLYKKLKSQFLPDKNFITRIEKQAAKTLETGLKKNKVISGDTRITIERIEEGLFGTAYKISFFDKKGHRIFKDKVIKYYKNFEVRNNLELKLNFKKVQIIKENIDTYTLWITEIFDDLIKRKILNAAKAKEEFLSEIAEYKKITLEQHKEKLLNKVNRNNDQFKVFINKHGLCPEANNGNYIRKVSGHDLQNSDIIKYYYTDLNNNYALLDFSNLQILGPVVRNIDFDPLGISPRDIENLSKIFNYVEDRLVDYGGFSITNKVLSQNSVARKVYKQISHINEKNTEKMIQKRINRWKEIYTKAVTNKISQSSDILLGLQEARKLIPEKYQNELIII